jgi:hypothetical protein
MEQIPADKGLIEDHGQHPAKHETHEAGRHRPAARRP